MGLILFNKPPGITSFDSLKKIKRSLKTGKVGHTGTLDKFASGLLIVLVGGALKLSSWFTNCDKQYIGKIYLGAETSTLDPEGEVTLKAPCPSCADLERVLPQFTGFIMQAPPAYSAIHINGRRASDLARSGKIPEMKMRPVTVYQLELQSYNPPFAEIFVHCSSGTYIRSLARDIALAAGSCAHLTSLVRTKVAGFELPIEAVTKLQSLEHCPKIINDEYLESNEGEGAFSVLPVDKSVMRKLGLSWIEVDAAKAQHIFYGKPLELIMKETDLSLLYTGGKDTAIFYGEKLIAIASKTENKWKYGCVFNG